MAQLDPISPPEQKTLGSAILLLLGFGALTSLFVGLLFVTFQLAL